MEYHFKADTEPKTNSQNLYKILVYKREYTDSFHNMDIWAFIYSKDISGTEC